MLEILIALLVGLVLDYLEYTAELERAKRTERPASAEVSNPGETGINPGL